jgi:predicted dehydrogenase
VVPVIELRPRFGWAIIGPGAIAHRFAEAVHRSDEMHLEIVQGRSLARASEFAHTWTRDGVAAIRATESLDAVLADERVDGVYIATPHAFHADAIRDALLAKKPVLCEKPMVTDARKAEALVALARAQNTFLMEAVWTRFLPLYDAVAQWLRAGEIGAIRSMQSSFCFNAPFNPTSRLFDPAQAGGALLDIGIYNLTATRIAMLAAFGECPDATQIDAKAMLAPSGVDQRLHATLHFENGIASQFVCAIDSDAENAFRIYGERGVIETEWGFWQATRATLTRTREAPISIHHPFRVNGFEYEIEAAVRTIRDGRIECERMPHSETIATLRWMDRIRAQIGVRYPFD